MNFKINRKLLVLSFLLLFVVSSFSFTLAAEGWELDEGDKLYYYVEIKDVGDPDDMLAKGMISFVVNDLTATSIQFSIDADLEGSDALTYINNFETYDDVDLVVNEVLFDMYNHNYVEFFIKTDYLDEEAASWQAYADSYDGLPQFTVDTNFKENEWEVEVTSNTTDYHYHGHGKYTTGGVLLSYRSESTSSDGSLDREIFAEKSILPFKSPIAVPNLYVYIAAGAVSLLLIGLIACICKGKKKKY